MKQCLIITEWYCLECEIHEGWDFCVSLTIMPPMPKIVSDTWEVINNIC